MANPTEVTEPVRMDLIMVSEDFCCSLINSSWFFSEIPNVAFVKFFNSSMRLFMFFSMFCLFFERSVTCQASRLPINANAETFLGYTTGSYRWQIGPQVRYQMLPSLVDKYPNREYLFNYGLKVGVVKQLK